MSQQQFYEQVQKEQEWLEYLICHYCYKQKGEKQACCGEVHFCQAKELENVD